METIVKKQCYHDITCKSALHKLNKFHGPYEYDLNIYRGCEHHCRYCYALYTQRYMQTEGSDFYQDIYIKTNIAEALRKQLSSSKWEKKVISIGSITDSYQPIEAERKLMRDVLKVMIEFRNPIIISTKSDLILRDLDLIKELAETTYVNIASTITTMDEKTASILEPSAPSPHRRVEVLKTFRQQTKASIGFHTMPFLPYISDDEKTLEHLMQAAKDIDVSYMLFGPLRLVGDTKKTYFEMLKQQYPQLVSEYYNLYRNGRIEKSYLKQIYHRINILCEKYQISQDYMQGILAYYKKQRVEQLSLW